MSEIISGIAVAVAVISLTVSVLSWRSAESQAKAAIHTERFAVFTMTQEFLRPWFRDGRPDMVQLRLVIDGWQRSKFLFSTSVTKFLRQLWVDAINADYNARILAGEIEGDRLKAAELDNLKLKYLGGTAMNRMCSMMPSKR